jgi:hypothetical protein
MRFASGINDESIEAWNDCVKEWRCNIPDCEPQPARPILSFFVVFVDTEKMVGANQGLNSLNKLFRSL